MKKAMMFVALASALGFNSAQAVELTPTGDVRFRYESKRLKYDGHAVDYAQDRWRTRVRFGVNAWINDELSAGVSLATGDISNPVKETVSRNETYSGLFQPKSIYLNEAFIDYHPMSYGLDGKFNLIFGKRDVARTIIRVDDLLYDGDITLEGATLQYGKASDGKEKDGLIAVAGYYFLDEQFGATDPAKENDPLMTVVQVAYKGEFKDMTYMLGVGDNNFRNLSHISSISDANNVQVSDRNVVELFGTLGGQVTETLPWKAYGQYAHNTGNKAINTRRNAWLTGVTLGDAKQPGQWAIDLNYNRIEKDSLFPIFTDSDRKVATYNTNTEGWEIGTTYHLVQNMTVGAKYYNYRQIDHTIGDAGNPRLHTLQADLVVKF
jgi:hypothetical protein